MSPQYQMYNALMQNMRQLANFNQQQMPNPFLDSKPTTSAAGAASHGFNSAGGGGPITTPKRKKMERESKKDSHIKKPLNAFMWFMKENRQKVLNEDGNASKQSAELNTILGKMWHDLPKDEQQKYYEKAKEERENHQKLYPNWSARENYAVNKKKRKKRERSVGELLINDLTKILGLKLIFNFLAERKSCTVGFSRHETSDKLWDSAVYKA